MSLGKFFRKLFHISKEDKREIRNLARQTAVDLALDRINKKLNKNKEEEDSTKPSYDGETNPIKMNSAQLDRLYNEMNEALKDKEN